MQIKNEIISASFQTFVVTSSIPKNPGKSPPATPKQTAERAMTSDLYSVYG